VSDQEKRGPGRPRRGTSIRVRVTRSFSSELVQALEDVVGNLGQDQSNFMEEWLWQHPLLQVWRNLHKEE
jgi:hypothetical protein